MDKIALLEKIENLSNAAFPENPGNITQVWKAGLYMAKQEGDYFALYGMLNGEYDIIQEFETLSAMQLYINLKFKTKWPSWELSA